MSSIAFLSLLPAAIQSFRRRESGGDRLFQLLLLVAFGGVACYLILRIADGWDSGFSFTLWVSVASSLLVFFLLCLQREDARHLSILLLPYLLGLALIALLITHTEEGQVSGAALESWLVIHIAGALIAYAFATLAAVAAVSVLLQENALKRKRIGYVSERLPALADGERLERALLMAGEVVLGISILSGMALQYFRNGDLMVSDHKTLFSLAAFILIAVVILLQRHSTLRGQRAGRWVLFGYLLLTLAYPGVKFVSGVLLS